jgi:hypothetical protein
MNITEKVKNYSVEQRLKRSIEIGIKDSMIGASKEEKEELNLIKKLMKEKNENVTSFFDKRYDEPFEDDGAYAD